MAARIPEDRKYEVKRINDIMIDYGCDPDEDEFNVIMFFRKGEERQLKHIYWKKPRKFGSHESFKILSLSDYYDTICPKCGQKQHTYDDDGNSLNSPYCCMCGSKMSGGPDRPIAAD